MSKMVEKEFKRNNKHLKSEKIEEKINEIILNSDLDYWEILGMLEHIKMEFHRIVGQGVENYTKVKERFEDE